MKKTRILTVMLCITAGLGLLSFAACKPDEETPTATLTLSAGEGGTLTQTTYEVEVGASLAEYLKDVKVTPEEGLTFAGWYNGSTPVSTETMPESGLTLTAKYSVPCTLALYLADVNGTYGEATTTQETAIYGEAFTYSPSVPPHFTLDTEKENKLTSQKLGKGETFTAYLKRETYGVHYYVNAPAGAEEEFGGEIDPASVVYGAELDIPSASALTSPEWFRFAGWATEANGEVAYQAGEKVSPESDLFLYAVWDRAYEDRFGGGDFVFFPQAEEGVAILRRAGQEHRGTRDGNNFSFKEGDEEIVKGQVNANGTFMYYREGLEEETYRHFNAYQEVFHTDGATIGFDGYGNGTYTVGEEVKHGVISYQPSWMFYTFEGDGEHFDFVLTDVLSSDGSFETVFITVGEELGSYLTFQFYYEETEIKADIPSRGLMLDGLGNMEIFDIDTDDTIYRGAYESKGNGVVTLKWVDEDNVSNVANIKLIEYMGQNIHVFEDGWAGTYTDAEGNTLVLDGYSGTIGSAVWTSKDGTETKEGMYAFDYSPFGDILRLQDANGEITSYRISIDEKFSELGDGSYTEYILFNGELDAAVLLLGEDSVGPATLYIGTPDVKIEGQVTKVDGQKDLMLFTSSDKQMVFEFKLYSSDDFVIESERRYYCHYFTYYPVYEEGAPGVQFLESENGDELLLVPTNAVAVYTSGDTSIVGWYQNFTYVAEHIYIEFYDYAEQEYLFFEYFEGDEETAPSFATLGEISNVYYWYDPYNNAANGNYILLLFDGEDKMAFYSYYSEEEGRFGSVYGSFTYTEETGRGEFTADPGYGFEQPFSLQFALGTSGSNNVFFFRNDEFETEEEITFEGEPQLTLDAYGFAKYKDPDGNPLEGKYCFAESDPLHDKVYRIYAIFPVEEDSGYSGYFDVDFEHKTYVLCNRLIGVFYEDITREETLEFNGHDEVVYENIEKEKVKGTYTVIEYDDYGRLIAEVKVGDESYLIRCYYVIDDEGNLIGHYTKEIGSAGTYVSDKWEYLTIDTFGEAIYTDEYGVSYSGTVTQFTEHVVSFLGDYAQNAIYCKLEGSTFTVPEDGMIIDGDTLVKYLGGDETAIKIPDEVTKIAPLAFSEQVYGSNYSGAPIVSLDLNNVTEIGENAFNGCSVLKSVKGAKLKKIGDSVFYACIELASLDLPALEEIGEMAFHLCESLTVVELNAVKIVYSSAFSECYELTEISLPAAEELYEGVFFDCYALKLVTLGANLKQIGTPDEQVAGVFERVGGFEQARLKVVLGCTSAPVVGYDLFAGVDSYTVVLKDIDTVKAFYLADGWAAYNTYLGCAGNEENFGTYYSYDYGEVGVFILNETVYKVSPYSFTSYGAYEVREDGVYAITFNQYEEKKYTERLLFTFDGDGNIIYDYYGTDYTYFKSGTQFTLKVGETDAIVFTPAEYTSFTTGVVYEVPAKWTKDGAQKDARVQLLFDQDFNATMYLKADGDRYKISLPYSGVTSSTINVSLGASEFDPVITRYTMSDESLLVVSQNDRAATKYTVSFVLAAIRDENNVPFSLSNVAVEKNADGTFTAKESSVFAGYSYKLTFTVNGDGTFSYTYTCDREIVVNSADESAKVIAYQSASGEITSVTLFVRGSEVGADKEIENFVLTHEEGSKVYRWLVYKYNYAGSFTFTFMGEGETLTGFLSVGTVVTGDLDGVYVIAFYEGTTRTDLYMRGMDEVYGKVEDSDITEEDGYLTVKFQEMTFYVTLDLDLKEATIVFADMTYQSNEEYSDLEGAVRVVKNPDGATQSMTLTVDGKEYAQYTEYYVNYETYYVFTNGTDYYYVTMGSSNCRISSLTKKEITGDNNKLKLTLLIGTDGGLKHVANAAYDGKPVTVNFFPFYDYNIGEECAWLEVVTTEGAKFYRANVTEGKVEACEGATLTTEDGFYRVTLVFEDDKPVETLRFEVKLGDAYVELPISYSETIDYTDQYNYVIGTDIGNFYFNIVKEGDVWKVTFVDSFIW